MKKFIYFICAVFLLGFGVAQRAEAAEFTVEELAGTATVTADSLNVRSGPSQDYDALGKAKKGEEYPVTGQASTGWYRINYKGEEGYISDHYTLIVLQEPASPEDGREEAVQEDGEDAGGFSLADSGVYITGAVILVIIVILLVSIGITVKRMIAGDDYEEEDGEDDDEDEEDVEDAGYPAAGDFVEAAGQELLDAEEGGGAVMGYGGGRRVMEEAAEGSRESGEGPEEEDYRLYIDPRYFEDDTPEETEAPVVPSLSRPLKHKEEETDRELEEAMEKLNELQLEIERIKAKKGQ